MTAPPSPVADQEIELVVVETGRTFMYPDEVVAQAFGNIQMHERGFITGLKYFRVRRIE